MESANLPKRYLDADELAIYLGIPKSGVYRLVEARKVPFIRVGGKATIRFDVKAVDKWMERQLIPAVAV